MDRPQGTTAEVFLAFLKLGLTSFGGPVAHIGFFRSEFVGRRKWLDEPAYADLVALCQFMPGPASSQVGIAIGKLRAGYPGAFAAWVAFTLPSVVALLLVAFGAASLSGPIAEGALHGLKLAALAVVAQAVWAMSQSLTPDWTRRAIALLAAGLMLALPFSWTQVLIIGAAALAGYLRTPNTGTDVPPGKAGRSSLIWLGAFFVLLIGLPLLALAGWSPLVIAEKFYRAGALVFGGGHVVLPLLDAELVRPGLISENAFLAGYGAAQAVPGPLFSFAAYAGAMLNVEPSGVAGATLAIVAIYVPSFLLVFGLLPIWQSLRGNTRLRAGLNLANAAVVGLLLAALYNPVFTGAVEQWWHVIWAAIALALLLWRWPPWLVVIASAVVGAGVALV
ncbi:chromate efflux transporter [Devosia sp.]|uniref:chromate efflux transporter n=1 Tax=Devosia sp. TaxID=1871048 RepID=UPI003A93CBE2